MKMFSTFVTFKCCNTILLKFHLWQLLEANKIEKYFKFGSLHDYVALAYPFWM